MIPKALSQIARGFLMGAADVVPGVSGGTIALVLGIYQRLIETVREGARALGTLAKGDVRGFIERLRTIDLAFIVPLGAGIVLAIGTLGSVIEQQLHDNPENMSGLFFGLVLASVAIGLGLLSRRTNQTNALILLSAIVVFVLLGFQSGPVLDPSPIVFVGAGALAICAMILPGISGSFILLMIGMYAPVIGAVGDRALGDLALVALGAVVGLALFSSLLGWVLDHHFNTVMAVLIGLMLGSLRVLWPWPHGVGVISEDQSEVIKGTGIDWPSASAWFVPTALAVVGAVAVLAIARLGKRTPTPVTTPITG